MGIKTKLESIFKKEDNSKYREEELEAMGNGK